MFELKITLGYKLEYFNSKIFFKYLLAKYV